MKHLIMPVVACVVFGLTATNSSAAHLEKYLPDDTQVILQVHVRRVLESKLAREYLLAQIEKQFRRNKDLLNILEQLNFDPWKDLARITIALPPKADDGEGTIFVTGNFDIRSIEKTLQDIKGKVGDKLSKRTIEGIAVYEGRSDDKPVYFSFLNRESLILSLNAEYVQEAIAKAVGKRIPKLRASALTDLVTGLEEDQTAWIAGLISEQWRNSIAGVPFISSASSIEAVSGSVTIKNDLTMSLRLRTANEESAAQLRNALGGISVFLNVINRDNPFGKLTPVVNHVAKNTRFSQDGVTVGAEVTIPEQLIRNTIASLFK
ncbi:MAG: hypothetical protein KatS3mg105_4805 [Gemmatales bacterium]|nr:MAG: hypothetical protein KatS3mg105_4805 [Gemmatales bacterium]